MKRRHNFEKKEGNFLRRFFYALLFFSFLALLFFVVYKLSGKVYQQNQINKEIEGLQEQIDELDSENQDLEELISYLQTKEFKEKELKEKLNLVKDGEHLVLVKGVDLVEEEVVSESASEAQLILKYPNYYYWWHYFFSL